jgi:hypothetical protein
MVVQLFSRHAISFIFLLKTGMVRPAAERKCQFAPVIPVKPEELPAALSIVVGLA